MVRVRDDAGELFALLRFRLRQEDIVGCVASAWVVGDVSMLMDVFVGGPAAIPITISRRL